MMPTQHPLRLFLFENGSLLSLTAQSGERTSCWQTSLVLEPSANCLTTIAPNEALPLEESFRRNTEQQPRTTPHTTPPCQFHHRVSRYCSNALLPPLRQVLTFRNTYHTHPILLKHQPTQTYLGACNLSTVSTNTMSRATPIQSVHWPDQFSIDWCHVHGNDGAVQICSMDGNAHLVLAPHRQLFQLHYPAAVVEPLPSSVSSQAEQPGGAADTTQAEGVAHGGIVQLVWTRQCPQELAKVLLVALETAARLIRTMSGEYMLLVEEEEEEEEEEEGKRRSESAARELEAVSVVTELLPTSTRVETRLSWDTAMVELGGIERIASESTLLCMSSDRLPLQRRVTVEWTPSATYWLREEEAETEEAEEGGSIVVVGCLLHATNTFLSCETKKKKKKTSSTAPWIHIYRAKDLGTHVTLSASTHVPDAEEARVIRHMLHCVSHCRLVTKNNNNNNSQKAREVAREAGKTKKKINSTGSTATIKETCTTPNVGTFTMYEDGRLRGVFTDRTLLRIDSDWMQCEVIRKDGIRVALLCANVASQIDAPYVRTLLEFGQWSNMTPLERNTHMQQEQDYTSRVVGEADRIRRFLYLENLENLERRQHEEQHATQATEKNEPQQCESDNPFLVPPVRTVLQQPILSENPSFWVAGSSADTEKTEAVLRGVSGGGDDSLLLNMLNNVSIVPGRAVMERYMQNALSNTAKFLEQEERDEQEI